MEVTADKQGILKRIAEARAISSDWHVKMEENRRLYKFNHYNTRKRKGEERYPDPSYTNTVDLAVGILGANKVDWRVIGWQSSIREEQETSKIEKYLTGLIDTSNRREEYDIPLDVITNIVRDGAAVLYSVWDTKLAKMNKGEVNIPTSDDQGSDTVSAYFEPPIRVQSIDPASIFLVPGGPKRWLAVAHITRESVYDVEQRYEVKIARYSHLTDTQKTSQKDDFIDYWELVEVDSPEFATPNFVELPLEDRAENVKKLGTRNAIIFAGEFLRDPKIMPGYEDLPYTIAFFKSVDRFVSADWGHSVLEPMKSSVEQLEKTINRRARQISIFSSLPLFSKTQSGRTIQADPSLGSIIGLRPDEDLAFPRWQGNPPDIEEQIGYLRNRVQQSSFHELDFASQPSGYAMSQVGDQNRIRLEPPLRNLKLMWETWATKALKLTAAFASDSYVRVFGTMRGRQFGEQVFGDGIADYKVECIIKPRFPHELTRNVAFANQLRGLLSDRTIGERFLDIEQSDDEEDRKTAEQLRKNPTLQQYVIITMLMELAEDKDKAAILLLKQIESSGMPGQPGRPAGPPGMVQPEGGLMSATGAIPAGAAGAPPEQGMETQLNSSVEVPGL
jgi:PAS domain-containing protein